MKKTTRKHSHHKLVIRSEVIASLSPPQLARVVGGSVDCQGESYIRGVCPKIPDTGEEDA
jgi:hypothetical protein